MKEIADKNPRDKKEYLMNKSIFQFCTGNGGGGDGGRLYCCKRRWTTRSGVIGMHDLQKHWNFKHVAQGINDALPRFPLPRCLGGDINDHRESINKVLGKHKKYIIWNQNPIFIAGGFHTSCKTMPETWQTLTDYDRDIIWENGIQQENWVPMTSRTSADLKYYTFKTM